MRSNRALFDIRRQDETIIAFIFFAGFILFGIILFFTMDADIWVRLLLLLFLFIVPLPFFLFSVCWRITVYEQSIVYQTLFRKRAYQISQIKRVVTRTHWKEGEILWLYPQDGTMISIPSRCKNFERFHRYIQKKRAVEWESP